jgi:putative protein kinase ArgK-like GTPase of G3E family
MESSSTTAMAWQYGVLGIVALVFGYAIIHLFRTIRADQKTGREADVAREKERGEWATAREALRAEYERKHRDVVESFAQALREERNNNREHEDAVRREFAELMERISTEAARSSDATVAVLSKFYDRFVGPERGRKR